MIHLELPRWSIYAHIYSYIYNIYTHMNVYVYMYCVYIYNCFSYCSLLAVAIPEYM